MDREEMKSSQAWLASHGMRYGFTGSEYQGWTEWMATEQKVPRLLYERPFSWQCRAFLGKWMVSHGRMTEGIRVLHSVVPEWLFLGCTLLSLLLSVILGLAAGYWPARQASRMDAVSAMRDE